jgi:Predicted integral membrane protein (DUF2269)
VSWYEFLLFVHVGCAAIWIGGAFIFQIYGTAVERGGDPAEMAQFAGRAGHLGERVFVPASFIVLLAGIGLMIEGSWSWGQLWVVFALVSFAGSFALGVGVIAPLAKKLPAVGPTTPEGQAMIRRIFGLIRIDLLFLFAIVFAMTVKPTGDDGWTIVVGAVVLAALSALFLRQAAATRAASAPATGEA